MMTTEIDNHRLGRHDHHTAPTRLLVFFIFLFLFACILVDVYFSNSEASFQQRDVIQRCWRRSWPNVAAGVDESSKNGAKNGTRVDERIIRLYMYLSSWSLSVLFNDCMEGVDFLRNHRIRRSCQTRSSLDLQIDRLPAERNVSTGQRSDCHNMNECPTGAAGDLRPGGTRVTGFFVLDPEDYRQYLGHEYDWAVHNVPFIDIKYNDDTSNETDKSSHRKIEDCLNDIMIAYYYRWKVYKKHVVYVADEKHKKGLGQNRDRMFKAYDTNNNYVVYVVTEFLPNVPWAGTYNTIPAAAGHHIMEGRWIHDDAILNDYITFWIYNRESNPSSYTNWIGYAAYQRYLLNDNWEFIESLLDGLVKLYRDVYVTKYLRNITITPDETSSSKNTTTGFCWYQNDGYDAMEVSISGSGCRPTIASVMYGEAEAIVWLAQKTHRKQIESEFRYWMDTSRFSLLDLHWNPQINSFAVIPLEDKRHDIQTNKDNDDMIRWNTSSNGDNDTIKVVCDLASVRIPHKPVHVRELLSFMPWYYDTLIPLNGPERYPTTRNDYMSMWKELFDNEGGFAAEYGLRTAERRHPCYNYSWDHGDCWNAPSWPYETSRILTSLANVLNRHAADITAVEERDADTTSVHDSDNAFKLTPGHYWDLLVQYAKQHTRTYAVNDTANPIGSGHVFENLHPDLGYWNNRKIMYGRNDPNRDMGDEYNHSTFCDLILSGLFGIRPQPNGIVHINPLVPSFISKFVVDHVRIQGENILSLTWNDGSARDQQISNAHPHPPGLTVYLNGNVFAHRSDMGFLKIQLSENQPRKSSVD